MTQSIAILSLGPRTAELAARIAAILPEAEIHAPACAACPADVRFQKAVPHLQALFAQRVPIVGLCAAGILIRALAPCLADKRKEPPVLAVALDGSAVVPLLGGHHGANALALRLAQGLGAHAAITTASEVALGGALDEPPPGWDLVEDRLDMKAATAAILDGAAVSVRAEDDLEAAWLPRAEGREPAVRIALSVRAAATGDLVYRPRALALGVGCERGASPEALEALARGLLAGHGLHERAVACVTSIELKAAEPAVHALADRLGVPARFFAAEELLAQTERLSQRSEIVFRETGCWGVAEGAALAAVGPAGRLLVPKLRGQGVTAAVALAPAPVDPATVGRPQGRLFVVGLGPGGPDWRTHEAQALLAEAEELVGYGLYLDLIGPAAAGKPRHEFPLGAEVDRCRAALELAATGKAVALVCSGDPGIYALATLVFELLESGADPAWNRVAVTVSPGVSALQAAAARAGAPLGHDFCAISLSDLLTPTEVIERRVEAAAAGDFVIAFYNPVSLRRREWLTKARDILLRHRPPATPVILARNLGRADEAVRMVPLGELTTDLCDMLTLVLVGSSDSRRVPRLHGPDWIYTPRGYRLP